MTAKILEAAVNNAGLWGKDQEISFPLITRSGINQKGKAIHYYFNYSPVLGSFNYSYPNGVELLSNQSIANGQKMDIEPWGIRIVEEK